MIGMFDSGFGGLSTLKEFYYLMPEYDYIYLADSINAPYGNKSPQEIYNLSVRNTKYLFDKGANIVIIACNTAMVHSIRKMQIEVFPNKKILGVSIPGAEKVKELDLDKIGVLATFETVKTRAYKDRIHFLNDKIIVEEIESQKLVTFIEDGEIDSKEFDYILNDYLKLFSDDIKGLVLGCTHYSIIKNQIKKSINKNIPIIDSSYESAIKFKQYLNIHPEIKNNISKGGKINIITSGNINKFMNIGKTYYPFISDINIQNFA